MNALGQHIETAGLWSKVLLVVSLGKAFVGGAGLGLAALGVVDVAGTLGMRSLVDFIQHEHVLDIFAFGGGALSTIWSILSKALAR